MTQATLFVAFEDMGYDGHFIDSDESKIFTTREAAEAYAKSKVDNNDWKVEELQFVS